MNIGVLSTISRNAGGLFYSVRWLSKALLAKGCSVTVHSPVDEFSWEDSPEWAPIKPRLYHSFGPLEFSLDLRRQLSTGNSDLLHVHGIWLDNQWAAYQHQLRKEVPVVVSPRGMLDPWAVKNSRWKKTASGILFANQALKKATCIHALCKSEAEAIRAYGLKNPIAIIPNGVELPAPAVVRNVASAEGKRKLLFLGRIHPKKGLAELISGWARAKNKSPDACSGWQLLVAGWDDGGHLEALKKHADECRVGWSEASNNKAGELLFIGSRFGEEKDHLLRSVDAFILPSFSEGLPMSVLEAWSYGLPVVMTEYCNLPEGFRANAAIEVTPDAGSVSDGIIELLSMEPEAREALGNNGRALVENLFTWEHIADDMKSVYEWCISGGTAPSCVQFD